MKDALRNLWWDITGKNQRDEAQKRRDKSIALRKARLKPYGYFDNNGGECPTCGKKCEFTTTYQEYELIQDGFVPGRYRIPTLKKASIPKLQVKCPKCLKLIGETKTKDA